MSLSDGDRKQLEMFAWHGIRKGSDAVATAMSQVAFAMARLPGETNETLKEDLRYVYRALQGAHGMLARIGKCDPASKQVPDDFSDLVDSRDK